MDNNEVNALIDAFVGYREMLVPIQADMHEFLNTYVAMKNDVDKLDEAFSGDVQAKLSEIYKLLASQAEKSEELVRKVDQFLRMSGKYTEGVESIISKFESVEGRLSAINDIEKRAEEQIGRLDTLLEEKRRNYNIKELEKSLDAYNANLQTVGDFITPPRSAEDRDDNDGQAANRNFHGASKGGAHRYCQKIKANVKCCHHSGKTDHFDVICFLHKITSLFPYFRK